MNDDVYWFPGTLEELSSFETSVKGRLGFTLRMVQNGMNPDNVSPFRGPIKELKAAGRDSEFRLAFVAYPETTYVLHVFKKDTHGGLAVPDKIRRLIMDRAKQAEQMHAAHLKGRR